jgi:hypothetical protein
VSPSVTDVTVHVGASGTAATVVGIVVGAGVGVGVGVRVVVGNALGAVVVATDVSVDGSVDVVAVAVVATAGVDDVTTTADVSAVVASGAESRSRSATAAPLPDPSPPASSPTRPTLMRATHVHAQNGTRRQRRFHHGTFTSPDVNAAGSLKVHRQTRWEAPKRRRPNLSCTSRSGTLRLRRRRACPQKPRRCALRRHADRALQRDCR